MLMTKRKPATVGEIFTEEFMEPMGLAQGALAVTAATALILARIFGNSPDFWLDVQRRGDLWEAMSSPKERQRIARARPVKKAA